MAKRMTWAAVTKATPTRSTLAVMAISAMPPGAQASRIVAGSTPISQETPRASAVHSASMTATEARTAATKRGASRRKLCWKRAPRLQPSRSWAALVSHDGIEENCSPATVRAIARASGPIMNGLGRRVRSQA